MSKAQSELEKIKMNALPRLDMVSSNLSHLMDEVATMTKAFKLIGMDGAADKLSLLRSDIATTERMLAMSISEIKYPDGEFQIGEEVLYVPSHAKDRNDPLCENGFVKEILDYGHIRVVYLKSFPDATPENLDKWTSALTNRRDLRKLE